MDYEPPLILNEKALAEHWGQTVTVQGTYETLILPQSKRPGSPKVDSGRIQIRVGQTSLALEVQNLGFRPQEERDQFLNQKVLATGTLVQWAQLWGTPEQQSIVMPAIIQILKIEVVTE